MTENVKKLINNIYKNKKININKKYNYRYDIKHNNIIFGIILCEDGNDYICLIFDVKRYLMSFNTEYHIFGYYNTFYPKEREECINIIEKKINKIKYQNRKKHNLSLIG